MEYSYTVTTNYNVRDTVTLTLENSTDTQYWFNFDARSGVLSGTPTNEDVGDYNIEIKATSGCNGSYDSQTFTITVNDAPVANNVTETTDEDTAVEITLSGSDQNIGDTLTYSIVDAPSNGTLGTINQDNKKVQYTPNTNFNGTDTFTYKVNDGTVDSSTATVTITVNAVNDPPRFTSTPIETATEDVPYSYTITTEDVDAGDTVTLTGTLNGEALPTS